jgi:hypothetical protein
MAFDEVAAFPLCWPEGWPRTPQAKRKQSQFADWTVYTATEGLQDELRRLRATGVIISTSVPLRRDGLPLSRPPVDGDPGVAVYFTRNKGQKSERQQCIAIDRYTDVADNIRAITLTIEAMRAIERHGGAEILDRAFTGFAALPAPGDWRSVLGTRTKEEAEAKYRELVKVHHPDAGGSAEQFVILTNAIEAARREGR